MKKITVVAVLAACLSAFAQDKPIGPIPEASVKAAVLHVEINVDGTCVAHAEPAVVVLNGVIQSPANKSRYPLPSNHAGCVAAKALGNDIAKKDFGVGSGKNP